MEGKVPFHFIFLPALFFKYILTFYRTQVYLGLIYIVRHRPFCNMSKISTMYSIISTTISTFKNNLSLGFSYYPLSLCAGKTQTIGRGSLISRRSCMPGPEFPPSSIQFLKFQSKPMLCLWPGTTLTMQRSLLASRRPSKLSTTRWWKGSSPPNQQRKLREVEFDPKRLLNRNKVVNRTDFICEAAMLQKSF